jgi:hypothetical protein
MGGMFSFNGAGLKKFCKELEKLPARVRNAEAQTLSNIAFRFREEAAAAISGEFISRRPDFVLRQMRYERATPANLQAVAGSVGLDNSNFTGFVEQLGKPDQRVRAPTIAGRGGSAKNILPKANRMTPGVNFPNVDDIDGNIPIGGRLDILSRRNVKRFIMNGPDAAPFSAGLYEFTNELTENGRGKKVRMVQSFKKPKQPRRFDWIASALSKITEAWVTATHNNNLQAEFEKMKRTFK